MPDGPTRRQFLHALTATGAVTIAGCATPPGQGPTALLNLTPRGDADYPPLALSGIGIEDGPDPRADLMDDILDGGASVNDTNPPLHEDSHIYYNTTNTVYQLDYRVTLETPVTRFKIRLDIVQGTVVDDEAVQFKELPAVDWEKFAERGWDDGTSIGVGTSILYTEKEAASSALVPDPEYDYIVWEDGSEAAWFVEDAFEGTLKTYQYTAEPIAPAAEYGRLMRERFGFELFGLTDAERSIVEAAIDNERGYIVGSEQTPSPAFRSIADRFEEADRIRSLKEGAESRNHRYIVQFDGEWYSALLLDYSEEEPA